MIITIVLVPVKPCESVAVMVAVKLPMPAGVPVATVAVGGGRNAGILAVEILSVADASLQEKLVAFKLRLAEESRAKNDLL